MMMINDKFKFCSEAALKCKWLYSAQIN